MILNVTKKQSFTLSSDSIFCEIEGLERGFFFFFFFFLNEASILVFAELPLFHSI